MNDHRKLNLGVKLKEMVELRILDLDVQVNNPKASTGEKIHSVRTTIKFTRSIWRLVRDQATDNIFETENKRLRDAGRLLSPIRDRAMRLKSTNKLINILKDHPVQNQLLDLSRYLESQNPMTSDEINQHLQSAMKELHESVRALKKVKLPVEGHGWIAKSLTNSFKKSKKAMKLALKEQADHHFHEWRKQAKYLFLQLQTLRPLFRKKIKPMIDCLDSLQGVLGDDHDLVTLKEGIHCYAPQIKSIENNQNQLIETIYRQQLKCRKKSRKEGSKVFQKGTSSFRKKLIF